MISEIEFTRDHTSFWRTLSPLSEDFVRQINLKFHERHEQPLASNTSSSIRSVINEVGFELFARHSESKRNPDDFSEEELSTISKKVALSISRMRISAPVFNRPLSDDEICESKEIAHRLINYFSGFRNLLVRPPFDGCGLLNSCQGDVIADRNLYEIKAGDRFFRSIELRQLAVYLSLNHYSQQFNISRIGLYNPRKGFSFDMSVSDFAHLFSGLSAEELCHRIGYELTNYEDTRFSPLDE